MQTYDYTLSEIIRLQSISGNSRLIEVECEDSLLGALFERTAEQWTKVGSIEPFASVLAEERYKRAHIDGHLAEFRATGKQGIQQLISLAEKNGVTLNYGSLFELGCGVGRLTFHFAQKFGCVHAWDVSPGNLAECNAYMQETNVNNVKARLVCNVFDFDNVPEVDAFYSCIVLQHNPPPMQMHLLQRILARIRPGGVFLFQTVTHHDAYAFNIQGYLGWQPELEYEMHVLPMRHIVRAIQSSGLELLDVILDTAGGGGVVSNTFFGVRP